MKIFRRLVAGEKSHATAARKNRILAQFVTGIALQFKQIVVGVAVAGELAPLSTSVSKSFF